MEQPIDYGDSDYGDSALIAARRAWTTPSRDCVPRSNSHSASLGSRFDKAAAFVAGLSEKADPRSSRG